MTYRNNTMYHYFISLTIFAVSLVLILKPTPILAADIFADQSNYREKLDVNSNGEKLKPGDTLHLAPGIYTTRIYLNGISGEPSKPITITGPENGGEVIFHAQSGKNTVHIRNANYITIRHLTLDGRNLSGPAGVDASTVSHHITLEHLKIIGHGQNQQVVGIGTHQPAWNWIIRYNTIDKAGTGMYLGNSTGDIPFVGGLIEYNVITDTVGYNMQIKHYSSRQSTSGQNIPGMPTEFRKTIIRHNVFHKGDNSSDCNDCPRPNLLVGNFPKSGPGSDDIYEIYGNLFYQNPVEYLVQGTANIAMYDNIFVNNDGGAINLTTHKKDNPKKVWIFNNTVIANGTGIRVQNVNTAFNQYVQGNAVFAGSPLSLASNVVFSQNITDAYSTAGNYLLNPTGVLNDSGTSTLDVTPITGKLKGSTLNTTLFQSLTDWNVDFNGSARSWDVRGAYTSEGENPGWQLALATKNSVAPDPVAPTILSQPVAVSVKVGESASFNVSVSGTAPLSYQWRKNGVNITGATNASYNTGAVNAADNGAVFDCVVSNSVGSITSSGASLTVIADTTAPQLNSATATNATTVLVYFDKTLDTLSAENIANYQINLGISVLGATLDGTKKSVELQVSELTDDTSYTLTVENIKDTADPPNTIAAMSSTSFLYEAVETFEDDDVDKWTPKTPSRWQVISDLGDNSLFLNTSNFSQIAGDGLGEFNLRTGMYTNFEFSVDAKIGDLIADNAQGDFALVFAFQDDNNYYYMMFNNDINFSKLYKVVNGTREEIGATSTDWITDNEYHRVEIIRSGNEIIVTFDGNTAISISDSTYGAGLVGVGSLNDSAYFDNIKITELASVPPDNEPPPVEPPDNNPPPSDDATPPPSNDTDSTDDSGSGAFGFGLLLVMLFAISLRYRFRFQI